jgi:hypothetical protein
VWSNDHNDDAPRRTHHHTRRTTMIAPDHHERAGQILRHGRTAYGRLPTWQRQRPPGARRTDETVRQWRGPRSGIRYGRRRIQ